MKNNGEYSEERLLLFVEMFRFLCGLTCLGVPELAELVGESPEYAGDLLGAHKLLYFRYF